MLFCNFSFHWKYLGMLMLSMKVKVKVAQSCPTLCNHMDCSLPGSSAHGILQARILQWVAYLFSRGTSWPRNQTRVSCIAGGFFTKSLAAAAAKSLQSCPTLCDPIDRSPPGSPVHGILQARIWRGLPFPAPVILSGASILCRWHYFILFYG